MVCEYNGGAGTEQYNIASANNNPNNQKTCDNSFPLNGLVAWYPFNGDAIDASGNGNNGIVHGATLTTDRFGNTNAAYYFNGTTDYIELYVLIGTAQSTSGGTGFEVWFSGSLVRGA